MVSSGTTAELPALPAGAPAPHSAGRHVTRDITRGLPDEAVELVIERLTSGAFSSTDAVYVTDPAGQFLGAVTLPELFAATRSAQIARVMDAGYPRVRADDDQESAATEALRHRVPSVAVIAPDGRLIGAVPASALLDILRDEHVEDLHRLAGIQREETRTRSALEAPPLRRARHRLPWLLCGLAGSMLAAIVMSRFERVLENKLAIAFFVPAIVYLADAIGTQTEAVVVRGLSLSRRSLRELLAGELRTGLVIGTTLAAIAFPLIALALGDVRLAAAVALSVVLAGGVATSIGLLLPWIFQRLGSDPALGSGPVATIIQDVLSLLIYFGLASTIAY